MDNKVVKNTLFNIQHTKNKTKKLDQKAPDTSTSIHINQYTDKQKS